MKHKKGIAPLILILIALLVGGAAVAVTNPTLVAKTENSIATTFNPSTRTQGFIPALQLPPTAQVPNQTNPIPILYANGHAAFLRYSPTANQSVLGRLILMRLAANGITSGQLFVTSNGATIYSVYLIWNSDGTIASISEATSDKNAQAQVYVSADASDSILNSQDARGAAMSAYTSGNLRLSPPNLIDVVDFASLKTVSMALPTAIGGCPQMDIGFCPDGSTRVRVPPTCNFAPCGEAIPSIPKVCYGPGNTNCAY